MNESEASASRTPLRCSVVIPTWQRAAILHETLHSVLNQSYEPFDVHVVSDGEDDALRALAEAFSAHGNLHWHFHATNRGQAAARNTGARAASGDFLLFLDDDTPAVPDWIAFHMDHHHAADERRKLAVVGRIAEERREPLALPTDVALQRAWERTLQHYADLLSRTGPDSIGEEIESAIAFGLNCSIRRDVFLSHGGYLEKLRVTDEDMEFGLRLYLSGVETVLEPRAIVTHQSTKDLTAYFRRCWAASGTTDVHRVFDLGQQNTQTRRLVSIHRGYLLTRIAKRLMWHGVGGMCALADALQRMGNRTGSRLMVSAWGRVCPQALFWSSVRASGCTLERIKHAATPPKCALMLHSLCQAETPEEATYYLAPARFRSLMRWFSAAGYRTVTTDEWIRDEVPSRHALLTFDDGYDDLYTELLPWLKEHGATAVIYLVADHIGGTNIWDQQSGLRARRLLTLDQIREMQKHGVEFGSHTLTHPWLPGLSDADLHHQVSDSKSKLEDLLGSEVTSFAYPYGGVDRRVRAAVARAGYRLAFTTLPGVNEWNDPLCQNRADIHDRTTLLDLRFHLRYGRSFRQTLANGLRTMEQQAPTGTLRSLASGLRRMGHNTLESRASRRV